MSNYLRFEIRYFFVAILLLIVEILIALYVHDKIIRPYIGDLLVVILLYCLVRSFLSTPVFPTAIAVLLFSYLVEVSQYFHLLALLGLDKSTLAKVIMGSSFEWIDMIAYTAGTLIILFIEKLFASNHPPENKSFS